MCELLHDNGYSTRLLPDKALSFYSYHVASGNPSFAPARLGYNTPGVVTTVSFGTNSASKYITTYSSCCPGPTSRRPPPPKLGCVLQSNALALSWPSNFAGFNLETSTSLPPAGVWQTVAGPYRLSNGSFGLSVPTTTEPQQFFRLRKPLP
jgi:hypothetical protein